MEALQQVRAEVRGHVGIVLVFDAFGHGEGPHAAGQGRDGLQQRLLDGLVGDAAKQVGVSLDDVGAQLGDAPQAFGAAIEVVEGHGKAEGLAGLHQSPQAGGFGRVEVAELEHHVLGAQPRVLGGLSHGACGVGPPGEAGGIQVEEEGEIRPVWHRGEGLQRRADAKVIEGVRDAGLLSKAEQLIRGPEANRPVLAPGKGLESDDGPLLD